MKKALKIFSALMALVITFGCFAFLGNSQSVEAASYPYVFPQDDCYNMKIKQNYMALFKFDQYAVYTYEKLYVKIYKGTSRTKKNLVQKSVSSTMYSSEYLEKTTVYVDFKTKGLSKGTYTVEYYPAYYSLGSWHYAPLKEYFRVKIVDKNYGWHKNSKGKWFCDTKGKAYKSTWKTIDGKKYYFNKKGYAVTGWNTIKGKRYYFNGKGELKKYKGLKKISGKYYYFTSKYYIKTGWKTVDGKKYYFTTKGAKTGWQTISKKKYYFSSTGVMAKGVKKISGKYYYFDSNGVNKTGWQTYNGNKYYFTSKGAKIGWYESGGHKYYFDKAGVMAKGLTTIDGNLYYFNDSGYMQTGKVTIDGQEYVFGKDGKATKVPDPVFKLKSYTFNESSDTCFSNITALRMNVSFENINGQKVYYTVSKGGETVYTSSVLSAKTAMTFLFNENLGAVMNDGYLAAGKYIFKVYSEDDELLKSATANVDNYVEQPEDEDYASLLVWSFNEEFYNLADRYSNVNFDYVTTPASAYRTALDLVMSSGEGAPDMYIADEEYVQAYVNDPTKALSISDLGIKNSELSNMFKFTKQNGSDNNGTLKALTWNANPGLVFYNKSLTSKYLGVSNESDVAQYFSSWDSFLEASRTINTGSKGKVKMVAGVEEITRSYLNGRSTKWITKGNLNLDPVLSSFLDLGKTMTDENLTWNSSAWSEKWMDGASDGTIVSYFAPLWLMQYSMYDIGTNWGIAEPPSNFSWGGSYMIASRYCDMKSSVAQLMRDLSVNTTNLTKMANNGDFINNISVMNSMTNKSTWNVEFLGGKNPVSKIIEIANKVDASNVGPHDSEVQTELLNAATKYFNGTTTSKVTAVNNMKTALRKQGAVTSTTAVTSLPEPQTDPVPAEQTTAAAATPTATAPSSQSAAATPTATAPAAATPTATATAPATPTATATPTVGSTPTASATSTDKPGDPTEAPPTQKPSGDGGTDITSECSASGASFWGSGGYIGIFVPRDSVKVEVTVRFPGATITGIPSDNYTVYGDTVTLSLNLDPNGNGSEYYCDFCIVGSNVNVKPELVSVVKY